MSKAIGKYVTVSFPTQCAGADQIYEACADSCANRWVYEVPKYLKGKLKVGDCVIVSFEERFLVGVVDSTSPVTSLRKEQVRTIVDKVDVKRYLRYKQDELIRELLLADMAEEQSRIDALCRYRESGKEHKGMERLLEQYDRIG